MPIVKRILGPISHKVHEGCCSQYSKKLEKIFGPGKFNQMIEELECLKVNRDFFGPFTMGYYLTEEWEKTFKEYYDSIGKVETSGRIVDCKGKPIQRKPKNNNAILGRDSRGSSPKTKASIPFEIEVNQNSLKETLIYVDQICNSYKNMDIGEEFKLDRLIRIHKELSTNYDYSISDFTLPGTILQCYQECKSGRIYGVKNQTLQNVVKEVKKAALAGLPRVEFDFSNCHFAILDQISRQHGHKSQGITYYLENKREVRKQLAMDVYGEAIEKGLLNQREAEKIIKKCLISGINGARTKNFYPYWKEKGSSYSKPEIIHELSAGERLNGLKLAKRLSMNQLYRFIVDDIQSAIELVIDQTPRYGKGYQNLMGKCLVPGEENPEAQIISHVLQGAEARMLNVVLEECTVYVPMHDGFIVDEQVNPKKLEEAILLKTGFSIDIVEDMRYKNLTLESTKEDIKKRCNIS